jgi:DNA topoisomerase-3
MREIVGLTQKIVERAKNFEESGFQAKPLGFNAPNGKPMVETLRNYETEDKSVVLRKVVAGRLLEPLEARDLLEKRLIGPLQGFRSRLGRPFAAALKLNDANETEFVFDNAPINAAGGKLDLDAQEPIGICPICGGRIFETLMSFACENTFGDAPKCKMKIGKKILQQDIDRAQVDKLLAEKKTDLLRGFVSMRTRRKFSAFLVMEADGRTKFEFEPRKEGAGGKKFFGKKPFTNKGAPDAALEGAKPSSGQNGHPPENGMKAASAKKPRSAPKRRPAK